MNVLLLRWDIKPDKRIRRTFLRHEPTRRTSFYAADRAATLRLGFWLAAPVLQCRYHGCAARQRATEQSARTAAQADRSPP
jgi:hypothetical protein